MATATASPKAFLQAQTGAVEVEAIGQDEATLGVGLATLYYSEKFLVIDASELFQGLSAGVFPRTFTLYIGQDWALFASQPVYDVNDGDVAAVIYTLRGLEEAGWKLHVLND